MTLLGYPLPRQYRGKVLVLLAFVVVHVAVSVIFVAPGHLTIDEGVYDLMVRAFVATGGLGVWNGYEEFASPELVWPTVNVRDGVLVPQYPGVFALLAAPFYWLLGYRGLFLLSALAFPVALLAGCHWRAVASASATAVVLLGGSLIVLGAETWELYLSTTVPFQRLIMEQWTGALTQMVPSPFMAARLLDLGVPLGYAVQALSLLVAAAGVAWAFRGRVEQELQTATVLVATFLATPYIFNYDMTLLSVAIIYLVRRGLDRGFVPGERWLLGFAWLLPLLMMYLHAIFPVAPFVLAALFAVTLYHVQQARSITPISMGHYQRSVV